MIEPKSVTSTIAGMINKIDDHNFIMLNIVKNEGGDTETVVHYFDDDTETPTSHTSMGSNCSIIEAIEVFTESLPLVNTEYELLIQATDFTKEQIEDGGDIKDFAVLITKDNRKRLEIDGEMLQDFEKCIEITEDEDGVSINCKLGNFGLQLFDMESAKASAFDIWSDFYEEGEYSDLLKTIH
jgi:hypothetical protein